MKQQQNSEEDCSPMLCILFRAKAKPGKRQELIDFLMWDYQECKEEAETLRFDVWVDPADEDAVFVYEAYQDQAAFEKHMEGKPFQQWSSEVEPEWISEKWTLFAGEPLCLLSGRED